MKPLIAMALLASVAISDPAFSQSYETKSFITNGKSAVLTGLNNQGQVVGYFSNTTGTGGFVSSPDAGDISYFTLAADGPFNGGVMPTAINDSGLVVGRARAQYSRLHVSSGLVYTESTPWAFVAGPTDLNIRSVGPGPQQIVVPSYIDVGGPPTQKSLIAKDINSRGEILVAEDGYSGEGDFVARPSSSGYALQNVPASYVSEFGSVSRINDSGQIVVFSPTYVNGAKVIAPDLASFQRPNTLMGVQSVIVNGINSASMTAGEFYATYQDTQSDASTSRPTQPRAFIAESSFASWKALDGFAPNARSSAKDINDLGQVVGWAEDANGVSRAFVTGNQGIGFTDLNSLVTLPSGEYLDSAHRINEVGQILAKSNLGVYYFLNPSTVPEPGTLGLMAGGLIAVTFIRRQSARA